MTREQIIQGLYRGDSKAIKEAIKALEQQPCSDTISRADAVKVASGYCHPANIAKELAKLPPAQPKYNASEWCHDCSEYDQNKHCCPRFNRVIHNAVEEVKKSKIGHWIEEFNDLEGEAKIDETIKRYFDNAEYERTHGNLQGCLEFKQFAKLLKELKAYRKICHKEHVDALDKIRAEIEKLQTYKMFIGEKTVYVERDDVLAIIDKHKAESGE